MKYLEAKALEGKQSNPSIIPKEHKMQPGSRVDQRDPQSLVSSLRPSDGRNTTVLSSRTVGPLEPDPTVVQLAEELGVDLSTVKGSGPSEQITEKDVRKAAKKQQRENS
ncbi:MAG TPA: E3 binding domain-containing protein [Rhodothermales bacterium]